MLKANSKILVTLIFGVLISLFSNSLLADSIFMNSEDGIKIIAETYMINKDPKTPVIVLYHQAGWSRGEYIEIAPKINPLGFNCIAVDLRSGETVNNIPNLTTQHALEAKKQIRYIDALPDIVSSLRFINTHFPGADIIAWGSSYSAALVLHTTGEHPALIDGVLSFTPGEYFAKQGKSKS
jgi:dienelactone hydrolase